MKSWSRMRFFLSKVTQQWVKKQNSLPSLSVYMAWCWCKEKITHFSKEILLWIITNTEGLIFIKNLKMSREKMGKQHRLYCRQWFGTCRRLVCSFQSCRHNSSLLLSGLQFPNLLKWGWQWGRGRMPSVPRPDSQFPWCTMSVIVIVWVCFVCSDPVLRGESGQHRCRTPGLAVGTDRSDHPSGKKALVQPRGGARKGKHLFAKSCCRWRSQSVWAALTLRGAIWQSCWQELPCSMSAGDHPGLKWIRDAAKVAGGTNNHLVSWALLILPHRQGWASASQWGWAVSDTIWQAQSPLLLCAPWRGR